MKLTPQEDISTREEYFGRAMRVALQYLGSDMWKEGHKGEVWAGKIRGAYTNDINKNVKPEYASDPNHMNFMHSHITKIALDKRKDILETAARTAEYLEDISDYSEIIGKIEQAFGPCRLLIISEESSTILTSHRVDPIVVDTMLRQSRDYGYTIAVKTFEGKVRYYTIVIDRGTSEKLNQLKPEHLETIINPILKRHIQVKEDSFVTFVREYDASVVECEKNMRVPLIRPDYSEFISSVIEQSSDP